MSSVSCKYIAFCLLQVVTGVGGYVGHKVAVKYFTDHYPADKRAEAKVLDVGAGTGMVARGVRIK